MITILSAIVATHRSAEAWQRANDRERRTVLAVRLRVGRSKRKAGDRAFGDDLRRVLKGLR